MGNIFEIAVANLDKVQKYFDLKIKEYPRFWSGTCPLHDSDNPGSIVIYKSGLTTSGSWKCQTNNCHTKYGHHILGFIKGLLEQKHNKEFTHYQVTQWCEELFNIKADEIKPHTLDDKLTSFVKKINHEASASFKITEKEFLNRLGPATYFLERNPPYKESTLDYFKLGYCGDPTKPFYKRVVIPQHDTEGHYIIGCLGRIIYDKCEACKNYHDPKTICRISPKWKNSVNFPSSTALFNFHNAKKYIGQSKLVIVTESPGNTMRLHEAGFPMSVGSFGAKFSEYQKQLIDSAGCETIIIAQDVGSAGDSMVKEIREQCKYTHNIVTIEPTYDDDLGACNVETVKKIVGPYVDKVIK